MNILLCHEIRSEQSPQDSLAGPSIKKDCFKKRRWRSLPRVNYFEFVADNPERAKKFYQSVFGWKIEKWKGPIEYWLVTTGVANEPGIDGGFLKRQSPQDVSVNFIEVSDVDKYTKLIEKSGGTIVHPKQAVPGVGWMVYFKDPEGNAWGMMQNDRSAK